MKNKSWVAWAIIGALLAIVVGFWLYMNSGKNINWEEHYKSASKDPYGTFLLKELIKHKYDSNTVDLDKTLDQELPVDASNSNYVFIGANFDINDDEQKRLFQFVENGNNAFIASKYFPYAIKYLLKNRGLFSFDSTTNAILYPDSLTYSNIETEQPNIVDTITYENEGEYEEEDEEYAEAVDTIITQTSEDAIVADNSIDSAYYKVDSLQQLAIVEQKELSAKTIRIAINTPLPNAHKNYTFKTHDPGKIIIRPPYSWNGFSVHAELDSTCTGLTVINDTLYNFIKIPYGKGSIYIYSSPILLTNYFVKEKQGLNHSEEILSVLSKGKIFWDEVAAQDRSSNKKNNHHAPSYLKYILANESLRWAWYLLLATVLVYIIFESKRKHRIIPVMETVTNTSIEYVETTGRLYAQIGNHRKLIQLNMRLFLSTIQQKYGVKVDLSSETSIEWLATKSGIPAQRFEQLQQEYKRVTTPGHDMKTKDLHTFYQQMQFIYKKLQN